MQEQLLEAERDHPNKAKDKQQLAATMEQDDDEVEEMKKVGQTRDRAWQLEVEAVQKQHAVDVEALASTSQELQRVRQQLFFALESKKAALKEAGKARNMAEVNAKKVMDLSSELQSLKESSSPKTSSTSSSESPTKTQNIEVEEGNNGTPRKLEELWQELRSTKELESQAMRSLSESKSRVETLEVQLDKAKDTILSQTKQLEETILLLQEAKFEITSLRNEIKSLTENNNTSSHLDHEKESLKETIETLKSELQLVKENLAHAQHADENASSKVGSLIQEIKVLRTELEKAIDAEEKSRKAMDDLALVVIEVSKESNEAKVKLSSTQSELENAKGEAERWKKMLKTTEDKFQALLEEARMESDRHKCVSERLKLEAEDSILAWNGKELEFVNCIKRAEDESTASKKENVRLIELLRSAEDMAKVLRDENCKLRDILKQALNESSVAKEAAGIAREENSHLKDSLIEKEDMLQSLTRENERLRINEGAALETIKELKRLLSSTTSTTPTAMDMMMKTDEDITDGEQQVQSSSSSSKKQDSTTTPKEHNKDHEKKLTEILNLTLQELKLPNGHHKHKDDEYEDPEMAEMLKGSIFDVMDSPDGPKPVSHHRKMSSTVFTEDGELNLEDLENLDATQLEDSENDKSSQRKKKALYRRFGEMLKLTSFHRRETSIGEVK